MLAETPTITAEEISHDVHNIVLGICKQLQDHVVTTPSLRDEKELEALMEKVSSEAFAKATFERRLVLQETETIKKGREL